MILYVAGIPAGWTDAQDYVKTERRIYELGGKNRLVSYFYNKRFTQATLDFAKELKEEDAASNRLSSP